MSERDALNDLLAAINAPDAETPSEPTHPPPPPPNLAVLANRAVQAPLQWSRPGNAPTQVPQAQATKRSNPPAQAPPSQPSTASAQAPVQAPVNVRGKRPATATQQPSRQPTASAQHSLQAAAEARTFPDPQGFFNIALFAAHQPGVVQQAHPQPASSNARAAANPTSAQISREQLESAKDFRRQRAADATAEAKKLAKTPLSQSQLRGLLTNTAAQPESQAVLPKNQDVHPTNQVLHPANQAAPQSRTANAPRTQAQVSPGNASVPNQNTNQVQSAGDNRVAKKLTVSQEMVIVGHFCRYCTRMLRQVAREDPNVNELDRKLKEYIRACWALWVDHKMTRPELLQRVADRVRKIEAARNFDVIQSFKIWYQGEYIGQEQRAGKAPSRQQQAVPQRANSSQRSGAADRKSGEVRAIAANRASASIPSPAVNIAGSTKSQGVQLASSAGAQRNAINTVPAGRAGAGRGIAGKTLVARAAGPGGARKSPGARNVSRQPVIGNIAAGMGRGESLQRANTVVRGVAGKLPMVGRGAGVGKSPTTGRGSPLVQGSPMNTEIRNQGIVSAKSLLSNKPPAKTPRKTTPKSAVKVSPTATPRTKNTTANQTVVGTGQGSPGMAASAVGKRPIEQISGPHQGPLPKKKKATPKANKGPAARKKSVGLKGSTSAEKPKISPTRPDLKKPPKMPKQTESGMDELNVVENIVDIEDEEDKLGADVAVDVGEAQENSGYETGMLLARPRLHAKMRGICTMIGLTDNVSADVMEFISLATIERLTEIIESVKVIASGREQRDKVLWKTVPIGPDVYESMEVQRKDEQRSLEVAAGVRAKHRREQMELEEKNLKVGESDANKARRGPSSAADRKEELLREKRRREQESHREALSNIIRNTDARRKKHNSSKGLAPLPPLGQNTLPPLSMLGPGGGLHVGSSSDANAKIMDPLEKLKSLGPLVKLGRANDPRNMETQQQEDVKVVAKRRLTLRDALFFAERCQHMRRSSLLYKWYARLGTHDH